MSTTVKVNIVVDGDEQLDYLVVGFQPCSCTDTDDGPDDGFDEVASELLGDLGDAMQNAINGTPGWRDQLQAVRRRCAAVKQQLDAENDDEQTDDTND